MDLDISGNVGFPFGSHPTDSKALETEYCVAAGATQIDMVMDVGSLKSGRDDQVKVDIEAVVEKDRTGNPSKVVCPIGVQE